MHIQFAGRSNTPAQSRRLKLSVLLSVGSASLPLAAHAQSVTQTQSATQIEKVTLAAPTPQPSPVPLPARQTAPATQQWAIHAQATSIWMLQPAFHSPYQGPQSLSPAANGRETVDTTIYLGYRPWRGAELWA